MARVQKTNTTSKNDAIHLSGGSMTAAKNQATATGPQRDEVARRAYDLFLSRGGEHGHAMEDWLQAERELGLGRYN